MPLRIHAPLAALCLAMSYNAAAQSFPSKNVQLVVPFPAGGGADIIMRAVGQRLGETWGRNVVIDNRAGASGMIGAEIVAKAEPDGHTLLGHTSGFPATAAIRKSLPFDAARGLVTVATVGRAPLVLAVHPSVPAKNVKELIALAKANPGKLNYSSAGTGGNNHFAASLFATATGTKLTHVPYKGVAPASIALVSGEVEMLFASSAALAPQLKAGRIRALGVTTLEPSPLLPGLAPIAKAGVPGYSYELWWALFAPAGVPADRLGAINAAVNRIVAGPEMKKFLSDEGAEPWTLQASQLRDFLPKEIERYRKIAVAAGIEAQ